MAGYAGGSPRGAGAAAAVIYGAVGSFVLAIFCDNAALFKFTRFVIDRFLRRYGLGRCESKDGSLTTEAERLAAKLARARSLVPSKRQKQDPLHTVAVTSKAELGEQHQEGVAEG